MENRIIIVEDEEDIIKFVKYNMEKEGYIVDFAYTGTDGIKKINAQMPDAIILDIMLEDIDGFTVCKKLKTSDKTNNIPIIMLTAKNEDIDIVTGLEVGADDYITKPFSPRVLIARIRALLRRSAEQNKNGNNNELAIHEITILPAKYKAMYRGRPIPLSLTEFKILYLLATNPGQVFSRNQIISSIKGDDYPVTERSVDVQIHGLRNKLFQCSKQSGKIIETVRGIGYRIKE